MRVLLQRVGYALVVVESEKVAEIGHGLLVFAGIEDCDDDSDVEWIAGKIVAMGIFNDAQQIPNLSVQEIGGDVLLVSQFTLHALTKKGNRPSYIRAARPDKAEPLFRRLRDALRQRLGKEVPTGIFGADMKITLLNDGPVTIWIDSRHRE